MNQSSVDLITELHAQWMRTNRARTNRARTNRARTNHAFEEARALLYEARALLQDIEEKMDETWRVFDEELKAASLPKEDQEEELVEDPRYPDYKEPVPHPALEHVFAHMYDHIPYEEPALEPVPYKEPVPHPALEHMPYEEPVPHPALEHMP